MGNCPRPPGPLRKGLQRQIFSSLVEMSSSDVLIVEQTARVLARLVDPRAPASGLKALYAGFEDPEPIRHLLLYRMDPRDTIKRQIWWAEELARPNGLYRTLMIDADAEARYDALMNGWYNPHRRHQGLGYQSPIDFEKSYQDAA